ncbi:MAG: hypothetical protein ACRBCI_05950 [Cellvibrionaceae bacterium]
MLKRSYDDLTGTVLVVSAVSDNKYLFDEFKLPEQNLKKLSFCSHKPRQFQEWLEELPATQTKHMSVLLYKLLPEINHLNINGSQRLGIMNMVRPHVHRCIEGLAEEFLKQPLSMTNDITKVAAIAQALQRHICDGYMLVIKQLLQNKLSSTTNQELSLALYYGIHGLGQLLYRSYQLYIPRPPKLWKKLNVLYELSTLYEHSTKQIPDTLLETQASMSAQQAYFRVMILGCSHTNQLRQLDIHHLYNALEQWAALVVLTPARDDEQGLYWLNMETDDGPFYKTRYNGPPSNNLYAINIQNIIDLLGSHQSHSEESSVIDIPSSLRQSLLSHLFTCWQEPQERQKPRYQSNIELEICIGLKAAHRQLLHGLSFDEFIGKHQRQSSNAITMSDSLNGGLNNSDYKDLPSNDDSSKDNDHKDYVTATDISDDGYCLRWSKSVPPQVKSGEIVLLRKPDSQQWQAGTIRWTQRLNRHTYVGIQILPGYAEAAAASTTLENGTSTPFFRTLLLKDDRESETIEKGSSLLTPTIPFATKQNIQLQVEGDCNQATLTHLLLSSSTISQYSYHSV